jgi:PTS system nitrogen regulatory IIA component
MDIAKYICPELIIPELNAETKEEAVRQLVDSIFKANSSCFSKNVTSDYVYGKVIARENIQTTGLGNGMAFPHARIEQCTDLVVVIGVSKKGIDFKSVDGNPCCVICLMVTPVHQPYIILQMMAAFSRFFMKEENVESIKSESSPHKIAEVLKNSLLITSKTVLARDVMRSNEQSVLLETSIEQTTQIMHFNKMDVLPVVDEQNILYGEISCLKIFTYGIPDFFNQLQTVSFVKYLDPFEKYFKFRKNLKVKDLYDPSTIAISRDTTLMEIIFEMTVKNKSRLFVVDKNRLVGVIDRFTVIDRVLFF